MIAEMSLPLCRSVSGRDCSGGWRGESGLRHCWRGVWHCSGRGVGVWGFGLLALVNRIFQSFQKVKFMGGAACSMTVLASRATSPLMLFRTHAIRTCIPQVFIYILSMLCTALQSDLICNIALLIGTWVCTHCSLLAMNAALCA